MTTYEHAMLGANACLACGLHRKYGWRIVALAGLAAIAPDWDGLTVLWDTEMFDRGHRVWGHNIFSCFVLAILVTAAQLRWDFLGWIASRLVSFGPFRPYASNIGEQKTGTKMALQLWSVCYPACLSQILADAVVSGGRGLSDWELKPFWPISDWSVVYSMVPWGNVGVTVIFAASMLAMAKFPQFVQAIAASSLLLVASYIVAWGLFAR